MSATILELADFSDSMVHQVIKQKSLYIEDNKVLVYYNALLSLKEIERGDENLKPITELSQSILNYLIVCVSLEVCYNALAGNLIKVIEDADTDLWGLKKDGYLEYKEELISLIGEEDFYIGDIIPEDDTSNSANVFTWGRG